MKILLKQKLEIKQRIYRLYSQAHFSAAKSASLKTFIRERLQLASYWRLDTETTTIPPNFPPTICGQEKVRKFWDNVYTTRERENGEK